MKSKKTKLIAVVLVCITLMAGYVGASYWLASTSSGYQTAFQGLQAEFHSLKRAGEWWSSTETPEGIQPSSNFFGYTLNFDPDSEGDGWCNLMASQQPMLVDNERRYTSYPYVWTVQEGSTVTKFVMDKVDCTWSVNIWLSGSEHETGDWNLLNIVTWEPNYGGTELWMKITPKNFHYFDKNPDAFYIAPAYIGLSQPAVYVSTDQDGQVIYSDPDMTQMDVNPSATGETLGVYYARGGVPVQVESELLQYKDVKLDPQVFRGEYWIKVDLANFKPVNWWDWQIWHKWKYPSIQLTFQVTCFVVGEWKVQLQTGDVPDLDPHVPPSQQRSPVSDLAKAIGEWWSNPLNQLFLWLAVGVVILVLLAVFMPSVLTALFTGARRAGSGMQKAVRESAKKARRKSKRRKRR